MQLKRRGKTKEHKDIVTNFRVWTPSAHLVGACGAKDLARSRKEHKDKLFGLDSESLSVGLGVLPCEVESTPDPDTFVKSIAIHPPFLSRYFCKSMPTVWQTVVFTPPICITIRLPFVSRNFCRSIRVRGRWNTSKFFHVKGWETKNLTCPSKPRENSQRVRGV